MCCCIPVSDSARVQGIYRPTSDLWSCGAEERKFERNNNMFTRKKKAVFENGNSAPLNTTNSQQKSVSYDQSSYPSSDKMSKSKMLSPPPPVPQPATTTTASDNTVAKQLVFHCQLAHGSQTGFITGFSSVRELYQKIADYYEFPVEEVHNNSLQYHIYVFSAHNLVFCCSGAAAGIYTY